MRCPQRIWLATRIFNSRLYSRMDILGGLGNVVGGIPIVGGLLGPLFGGGSASRAPAPPPPPPPPDMTPMYLLGGGLLLVLLLK